MGTVVSAMQCEHNVLRNGYWTGHRCARPATKAVAASAVGPGADITLRARRRIDAGPISVATIAMCGQHAARYGGNVSWPEIVR